MFTISSFEDLKYKHDVYRGKDCMKKFFGSLRKQAIKWIKFKKKKMKLLTKKQQESYENAKSVIFRNKNYKINISKIKNIIKLEVRDLRHYTGE